MKYFPLGFFLLVWKQSKALLDGSKSRKVSGVPCVAVQCGLDPFSNVSNLVQDIVLDKRCPSVGR